MTVVDEPVAEVRSRRRRWWLSVLAFVSALIVAAAAVVGWVALREPPRSPEDLARAELQSAQLALVNAAGAHYTGRFTAADGTSVGLDLRVTNVGDATGTFEFAPGKVLTYLRIEEKTFMRGDRAALLADGAGENAATMAADLQILRPSGFHDIDVARTLKPASLGFGLDPLADMRQPIRLGSPSDDRSTTVISDTVTTYLVAGTADRIVLPNFDLRVSLLSAVEVADFYRDIRPTVAALHEAWDSETTLESELGWSDPCGTSCTAEAKVKSTPTPFTKITTPGVTSPVPNIFVWYRMEFVIGGEPAPESDCSGIIEMTGHGLFTIPCGFTRPATSAATVTLRGHPVLGHARADALLRVMDNRAERSRAKSGCPIDSLIGSPKNPGC
ncbi:hypothetical protein AB0H76_34660 [Nocardia sp. NPDC050712]|uniref:hypothetical protein n=1 Tax=Nocardia sp. NPDC050712 TaxID=3155518 RepID=UPI00340C8D58